MNTELPTGLIRSENFYKHIQGFEFPESNQRLVAVHNGIDSLPTLNALKMIDILPGTDEIPLMNHKETYIQRVRDACLSGNSYIDTYDNPINVHSYDTAILAARAMVSGVNSIFNSEVKNAMALVRPPGHHAEESSAMGFCLFNNAAIAARYAQQQYSAEKIVIIDFDVHHGNGTQHSFEDDPSVMYISIHQYPFYPGTGSKDETGWGKGLGTTVNYPLNAGEGDETYLSIIETSLVDKVLAFQPDFIILSAGFDAHANDPIGGMKVTTPGFSKISEQLNTLSIECCEGRLFSVLEGGYHLQALTDSVCVHLESLMKV